MKKLSKPPLERKWYQCPKCGTKLLIYDNAAQSRGIYIKCKNCKNEIEVKI